MFLKNFINLLFPRLRYGVDCTMEVLHEIALLSICSESNKIVHLKDVFQNKYQIILILE